MKKHKQSKVAKVLSILSIIVFILAFLILLTSIFMQKNPDKMLFGYRLYQVTTGSMEPEIKVGSIVLVKAVEPSELKVGDTISFRSTDPQIYSQINTHSIVKIEEENGKYIFTTQGVANPTPDDYKVSSENLIGKVVGVSENFGRIYEVLSNRTLSFCLTIVPLFVIFLIYFIDFAVVLNKPSEEFEEDKKDKTDSDRKE